MNALESQEKNKTEVNHNKKSSRLKSIDFVKGLAIVLICGNHAMGAWTHELVVPFFNILFKWLDVFGPSLFVFLSAVSVVFSVKKKRGRLSEKAIRNGIFTRGISIMIVGVLFNIPNAFTITNILFPFNLWGWNFLMMIGFTQILTYYIIKLSRGIRLFLSLAIIGFTYVVRPYLDALNNINPIVSVIYYILISPVQLCAIWPYASLGIIGSIMGELLFETMELETKKAYLYTFRLLIKVGVILIVIGIILPPLEGDILFYDKSLYYPSFLQRGYPGNMFYSLGMALLMLGISFYYIDIKLKNKLVHRMFIFYGKVSFSLFIIAYAWLPLFFRQFGILEMWFFTFTYVGFLGFLMYLWNKYYDGKYSVEWLMGQMTRSKKNNNRIRIE
jgi:hypothetical protein